MRCVLFLCLSVVFGLAAGFPQRPPQYDLPYNLPYPFHSVDQPRRHRDLVDESPETDDVYGQRGFARPEFGLSDFESPYSPISDMMTQMREMMIRLKQEMNEVLRRLPASGADGEGAIIPVTGDVLDLSKAQNKSTSRTEIIDGQVYTINETVIRSGNDDVGSIIRVKTIRVVPTDPTDLPLDVDHDETTVKDSTEESAEVAPVTRNAKNNDNNEIPNEKMPIPYRYAVSPSDQVEQHVNEIQSNTIDVDDDFNSANTNMPNNPRSLSNDLAVNYIAANRKRGSLMMLPSDVELIGVDVPQQHQYFKYDFAADSQVPNFEPVAETLETIEDVELRDEDLP